jgi:uncharacterized protein Yka (UPF0111/DUF47 family)
MITKVQAVESRSGGSLLQPALLRSALAANDRLKLYLTALQAAVRRAAAPAEPVVDLSREKAAAGVQAAWVDELVLTTVLDGDRYHTPAFAQLVQAIDADLAAMLAPLGAEAALARQVADCRAWLKSLEADSLAPSSVRRIVHGDRAQGGSVHILVMDLHRALNRLAAQMFEETVDGAHAFGLRPEDRPRIGAFMRGVNRTRHLKFDHPGLGTAATRDSPGDNRAPGGGDAGAGGALLIQNDIGENDVHVLVVRVEAGRVVLTYSDLHRPRFEFFQSLLSELGGTWSTVEPRVTAGLNAGDSYYVGTACFAPADEPALERALEGIGASLVFLIDWNRARKRLQEFVGKRDAVAVLTEAARREVGHMGWLKAGGERLLYGAMQDAGHDLFHVGERLEGALGAAAAREVLVQVLALSTRALQARLPASRIQDEVRVLLTRHVHGGAAEFDLLSDHAAYCHAVAQALSDALAGAATLPELATRAKRWERKADELVMHARNAAGSQTRWRAFAPLAAMTDDAVDALEEAAFLHGLIADEHPGALAGDVRATVADIARTALAAARDHVRSLAIARDVWSEPETDQLHEFLDVTWRVQLAERLADEQLRAARRTILRARMQAADLMLANDLAASLELATDRLLAASYALREKVMARTGAV